MVTSLSAAAVWSAFILTLMVPPFAFSALLFSLTAMFVAPLILTVPLLSALMPVPLTVISTSPLTLMVALDTALIPVTFLLPVIPYPSSFLAVKLPLIVVVAEEPLAYKPEATFLLPMLLPSTVPTILPLTVTLLLSLYTSAASRELPPSAVMFKVLAVTSTSANFA